MSWTDEEVGTIMKAADHLLSHFHKESPLQSPRTINNFMAALRALAFDPILKVDPLDDTPGLAEEILRIPLERANPRAMSPAKRARKPRPIRRAPEAA